MIFRGGKEEITLCVEDDLGEGSFVTLKDDGFLHISSVIPTYIPRRRAKDEKCSYLMYLESRERYIPSFVM